MAPHNSAKFAQLSLGHSQAFPAQAFCSKANHWPTSPRLLSCNQCQEGSHDDALFKLLLDCHKFSVHNEAQKTPACGALSFLMHCCCRWLLRATRMRMNFSSPGDAGLQRMQPSLRRPWTPWTAAGSPLMPGASNSGGRQGAQSGCATALSQVSAAAAGLHLCTGYLTQESCR